MDMEYEYKDDIRTLIERRDYYYQELARSNNRQTRKDDFMAEVYRKLLEDIEWLLDYNKV